MPPALTRQTGSTELIPHQFNPHNYTNLTLGDQGLAKALENPTVQTTLTRLSDVPSVFLESVRDMVIFVVPWGWPRIGTVAGWA